MPTATQPKRDQLLGLNAAARVSGVSVHIARKWVERGVVVSPLSEPIKLPAERIVECSGGRVMKVVRFSDLLDFLKRIDHQPVYEADEVDGVEESGHEC